VRFVLWIHLPLLPRARYETQSGLLEADDAAGQRTDNGLLTAVATPTVLLIVIFLADVLIVFRHTGVNDRGGTARTRGGADGVDRDLDRGRDGVTYDRVPASKSSACAAVEWARLDSSQGLTGIVSSKRLLLVVAELVDPLRRRQVLQLPHVREQT
jgi:hypothetical protein